MLHPQEATPPSNVIKVSVSGLVWYLRTHRNSLWLLQRVGLLKHECGSLAHRISTVQYGKYDTVVSKISKNGLYLIVSSPDSHRSWLSGLSDTIIPIDTLWACISKNIDSSWCIWTTFAGMGWVQRIGSWGFSDLVRSHTIKPLPNPKIAFNILNIHLSKIDKK